MTVHRTRPLPLKSAKGSLIVPESVILKTGQLLCDAGSRNPPHEGLVWWLGRRCDGDTLVLSCVRPPHRSGPQFVSADAAATGAVARSARALRLGIVAQVHSHPEDDTRHSDGDDDLVLMPYEGMFSLVVGRYGQGSVLPEFGAGLHQYQDARWIQVAGTDGALISAPAEVRP